MSLNGGGSGGAPLRISLYFVNHRSRRMLTLGISSYALSSFGMIVVLLISRSSGSSPPSWLESVLLEPRVAFDVGGPAGSCGSQIVAGGALTAFGVLGTTRGRRLAINKSS